MPSSLSSVYEPDSPAHVTIYGPSQLAETFRPLDRLCSQRPFLGLGSLVGTLGVLRVCCTSLPIGGGKMLSVEWLSHVVRLPCLGP